MSAYEYECLDPSGKLVKGVLEGDSPRHIRQQLREKNWIPLNVDEAKSRESKTRKINLFTPSISLTDLALVTRQLATLVHAGIPVEEALGAVAKQTEKQRVKSTMMAIRSRVLEGHSLARAMEDFPGSFPELYRATVAAGEKSGHLDLVLEQLADYTEARQDTARVVGQALIYPVVLFFFSLIIVVLLLTYVVPDIVEAVAATGQQLPLLTRILLVVSDFIVSYGLVCLVALVALLVTYLRALRSNKAFRKKVHQFMLRVPLLSRYVRMADGARLASTLNILTSSGVPLVEGLRIASQVMANLCIRESVQEACIKVQEGGSLQKSLEKSGYFSALLLQMISSGESSGELDIMLHKAAVMQDKDLKAMVATMAALLGPLTLVFMAGMVFTIVMAMLLPIMQMTNI